MNCRIFPGHSVEEIRTELARVAADPGVTVTVLPPLRPSPPAPPLDPKVMDPAKKLAANTSPGAGRADHVERLHRRDLSRCRRNPDLRSAGSLGRSRRQRGPWAERADRGPLTLCRPRLPLRPDQGLCGLASAGKRRAKVRFPPIAGIGLPSWISTQGRQAPAGSRISAILPVLRRPPSELLIVTQFNSSRRRQP